MSCCAAVGALRFVTVMVVAGYPLLDKLVASAVKFSKKLCILNKVKLLIADNELACQFRNDHFAPMLQRFGARVAALILGWSSRKVQANLKANSGRARWR